jgi:hypothetical protein
VTDPFTCPICGRASWHPQDAEHGWCGNCHGYTTETPPAGMRWVLFHGKDGSTRGRLLDDRDLTPASGYEMIGEGRAYMYDGSAFVEVDR